MKHGRVKPDGASGWRLARLKGLLTFQVGFPFPSHYFNRQGVGIRLVRNADLKSNENIIHYDGPYSEEYLIHDGDVLVGMDGEFRPCRWQSGAALLNQRVGRVVPANGADPIFIYYALFEPLTAIERATSGTTVKHLSHGDVEKINCLIPPLQQQNAIAEALSDVDALLGSLDALIAKKRGIKQAAVQQLLAGKTRLPGFSEEWEVKRLGEVGGFLKGSGVKKDESQSGELPCIRYGEIYTHHHDHIRSFKSWISPKVADTATPLRRGDVLFAGSGETKEEIGKCVAFDHDVEAYAGSDIVILRPNGVNSLFLGYLLNTHAVVSQKASRGQGDAVVHISSSALADICVSLPSLEEQAAIAGVISDVDAEIAALEVRRDKTRALKQGMMQQLLTGRIRLVEPAAREEQA